MATKKVKTLTRKEKIKKYKKKKSCFGTFKVNRDSCLDCGECSDPKVNEVKSHYNLCRELSPKKRLKVS